MGSAIKTSRHNIFFFFKKKRKTVDSSWNSQSKLRRRWRLGNRPGYKVTKHTDVARNVSHNFISFFFTRKKSKENLLFNEFLDPPRALPSCVRKRESWMNGPPARPRPRWPYSFPYIALVQEPPYIYISAGRDLFFFRQQKRAGDLHGCREKMLVLVFIHSLHAYYACPSSVCQKAKHFFFFFLFCWFFFASRFRFVRTGPIS